MSEFRFVKLDLPPLPDLWRHARAMAQQEQAVQPRTRSVLVQPAASSHAAALPAASLPPEPTPAAIAAAAPQITAPSVTEPPARVAPVFPRPRLGRSGVAA